VSDTPDRRNPLRLIVSKESQLRILWIVGAGVFFCVALTFFIVLLLDEWVWRLTLVLAGGCFISLWVSRKIAGPFYRIEKDLEALLAGAVEGKTIHLRPGDPLQHLAQLINELIERTRR
jgi:hypothetical protein